jgi:hypothetical protein
MHENRIPVIAALVVVSMLIAAPAVAQKTTQVLVVNGSSQPVPTAAQGTTNIGAATHFAQPEENLVTLIWFNGSFDRVHPDGTQEYSWSVPAGQVFVLTDYSWAGPCAAGSVCFTTLFMQTSPGFGLPVDSSGATAGSNGFAAMQKQVTVVMGAATSPFLQDAPSGAIYIHGYLTPQ